MLIEKEAFDKLCPSYQKALSELEKEYDAIPESEYIKKRKLLHLFSQHYLMVKELWDKYFTLLDKECLLSFKYELLDEKNYSRKKALYHFYGDDEFQKLVHKEPIYNNLATPTLMWQKVGIKDIESELSCPRKWMENTLKYYEEFYYNPLPPEAIHIFDKAKQVYSQILEAEEKKDQKRWFKLIANAKNSVYIINNIEYRLGKDLNNIELWELYIEYLKQQNDTKKLLDLYSRYCRYFIDDLKTKGEYKEAVKKYGPSVVQWKNSFDFETFEEEIIPKDTYPPPYKPVFIPSSISLKFLYEKYQNQEFSFPKTILAYLLENINSRVLHKLHQTCKYFFAVKTFPVCHNFWMNVNYYMVEHSILFCGRSMCAFISNKPQNIILNHKIIISNSLQIIHERQNSLSKFIFNVFRCHAKFIRLRYQNFTYKEFKFLVEHGNVEILCLQDIKMVNEKNENVPMEDILKLVPKIVEFELHSPTTTPQTYETLLNLNFINKFRKLYLLRLLYIEPYDLCKFLKKNLAPNSMFIGNYEVGLDENMVQSTKDVCEKELKNYWPSNQKPHIRLCNYPLQLGP